MRLPVFRCSLVLGALALGAAWGAAATAAHPPTSLTLYEKADFAGRSVTFHSQVATARQAFAAHSARSVGLWTLCEGRDPASKCQTVTGSAPRLKIEPAIVRPGVDAVALYEEPNLKGRRTVYSFASDQPPPFQPKSARTWGGPWTLCDAAAGHCQTIAGEHSAAVEVQVATAQPGRTMAGSIFSLGDAPVTVWHLLVGSLPSHRVQRPTLLALWAAKAWRAFATAEWKVTLRPAKSAFS